MNILIAVKQFEQTVWEDSAKIEFGANSNSNLTFRFASSTSRIIELLETCYSKERLDLIILGSELSDGNGSAFLQSLKMMRLIDFRTLIIHSTNIPNSAFYNSDITETPDFLIETPLKTGQIKSTLRNAHIHLNVFGNIRAEISNGNYTKAIKLLINLDDNNDWKYEALAFCFSMIGMVDRGIDLLQNRINRSLTSPRLLLALIKLLISSQRFDDVIKVLGTSSDFKDSNVCLHYALAFSYQQKGNLNKSLQHLQKAKSLEVTLPDIMLLCSDIYKENRMIGEAIRYHLKAIEASKGSLSNKHKIYDDLLHLGNEYWSGDEQANPSLFKRISTALNTGSLELNSKLMSLHSDVFRLHYLQMKGERNKIEEMLLSILTNKSIQLASAPDIYAEVLNIVSSFPVKDKVFDKLTSFEEDNSLSNAKKIKNINRHNQTALLHLKNREIDDAENVFRQVMSTSPENITANYGLASVYLILFKRSGTETYLKKSVEHVERIYPVDCKHVMYKEYESIRCKVNKQVALKTP